MTSVILLHIIVCASLRLHFFRFPGFAAKAKAGGHLVSTSGLQDEVTGRDVQQSTTRGLDAASSRGLNDLPDPPDPQDPQHGLDAGLDALHWHCKTSSET